MIEYKYDFNHLYIQETKAVLSDNNEEIYEGLRALARKYKCKILITYRCSS